MKQRCITKDRLEAFAKALRERDKSIGTREKYLRDVGCFAKWLNGAEITGENGAAWRDSLLKQGYAPASVNSMVAAVNQFLRHAGWEIYRIQPVKVQRKIFRDDRRELTREEYGRQGIGEDVYLATMLCLPRFLRETYEITGRWGYDRGFWTWRQTGGLLFRLGELEFEYRLTERNEPLPEGLRAGDPILSVHIPSDAKLTREKLDASYTWAKRFFSEVPGPWISEKPKAILCGTWLLSPELYGLLSENSGIRRFADDYSLYHIQQNDNAIYRWLYQLSGPVSAEKLPERTCLQRSVKGHLLSGGLIGIAWGILKD